MDNSEPESSEDSELYEQLAGEWNPMPKRCCALIILLIASPHLSENIPLFLIHQWQLAWFKFFFGHLAIGPCATNSGKWGIPEKSYKNVAQQ